MLGTSASLCINIWTVIHPSIWEDLFCEEIMIQVLKDYQHINSRGR